MGTTSSDVELLAASLAQPEAFAEIVRRYERAFMRKAEAILGSHEDARDAVQETFVRIYTAAGRFKVQKGATFSSWAYKILINQCFTMAKKQKRSVAVSLNFDPELGEMIPDQAGLEEVEKRFTTDYVLRLLSKLPVMLRRVVELHFMEGLSGKEIALQEGISPSAVRQRIHRAKQELRKLELVTVTVIDGL